MITVEFKDFEDMMGFARSLVSTVETREPVQTTTATAQPTQVTPPPVQEETQDTQAKDTGEEEKTYTMEEVRAKLAALNKAGKRSEVKALLAGFGAEKLSEIPKEKYTELMDKAGEI